jgi:hypothetical protein
MIPWSPPIMFWSMVGQASFHTARRIGPSTMERSKRAIGRIDPDMGTILTPAPES